MAVLQERPPSTANAFGQPLTALGIVCIVVAVLGIKLKWFKHRLVFNDPGRDIADAVDSPAARRGYRSVASAEPQIVRAIFRTGLDNDDYVDSAAVAAPLPPIRINASNSPFSRPHSLNSPRSAQPTDRRPESPFKFVPLQSEVDRAAGGEQLTETHAVSVEIMPSKKEDIVFASVEDLTGCVPIENHVSAISVDPPPYEYHPSSITKKPQPSSVAQLFASTPDLSGPTQPSATIQTSVSTPDLATTSANMARPLPRVQHSFFSFLSNRSAAPKVKPPTPLSSTSKKTKTVRVLKESKVKSNDKLQQQGVGIATNGHTKTINESEPASEARSLPISPSPLPTLVVMSSPIIRHSSNVKSPNATKTVRFVTPEGSDDEGANETPALEPPQPMKRTILNVPADSTPPIGTEDDPWAELARHRRDTEALSRNRILAAERVIIAPPPQRENSSPYEPTMVPDQRENLAINRPKTLREMQREQREQRERRDNGAVLLHSSAASRTEPLLSDTDA